MDDNLALLDNLAQSLITVSLKSVSAQPGGPVNGEAHIIGASPTGADWGGSPEKEDWFAVFYTNTSWHFAEPREGWRIFDQVQSKFFVYDGASWVDAGRFILPNVREITAGSPNTFEPDLTDTNGVILINLGSPPIPLTVNIPDNATVPFPLGTTLTFACQNGTITVTDDAAVAYVGTDPTTANSPIGAIRIGGILKIQKVATDVWAVLINGVV
jgi:hypothetical protein